MTETMTQSIIHPSELAELLPHQVRLVDVRTPAEFEAVHIAGAVNLPLDQLPDQAGAIAADDRPVVLVCQSGQRAAKAAELLGKTGPTELRLLHGGVNAWLGAGLPVRRGRARISLERQVRIVAGSLAAIGGLLALAVDPWFALVPIVVGGGLAFAGLTDTCGMAMLLAKLPYNRRPACGADR